MLQCRSGKRTGPAAIRIAIDLHHDGICTKDMAILRVEPNHVKQLLHPNFTPEALASKEYQEGVFAKGLAGGPGAAVGKLVFSTKKAEELKEKGESVILVRVNTSPEDVGGMWASVSLFGKLHLYKFIPSPFALTPIHRLVFLHTSNSYHFVGRHSHIQGWQDQSCGRRRSRLGKALCLWRIRA